MPILLSFFMLSLLMLSGCNGSSAAFTVEGQIEGAANLQVMFERAGFSGSSLTLERTTADSRGGFKFEMENPPSPGIYQVKIGSQAVNVVLEGEENHISIKGVLAQLNEMNFEIEGSPASVELKESLSWLNANRANLNEQNVRQHIENAQSPMVSMLLAVNTLGNNPRFVNVLESVEKEMKEEYPDNYLTNDFSNHIAALKSQQMQNVAQGQIIPKERRQPASNITLPDPDGKNWSLSDLKGHVVLLDFWAAWCGPCRRANPHIVSLYHQHKDEGFKVFNVSLDGVDSRTAQRFGSDQNALNQEIERQRQRWIAAIEQDKLDWPYHVSDLKKWESVAARQYGVRSIPHTVLLDRDGKIAAQQLRGQQLDVAIAQLLQE